MKINFISLKIFILKTIFDMMDMEIYYEIEFINFKDYFLGDYLLS